MDVTLCGRFDGQDSGTIELCGWSLFYFICMGKGVADEHHDVKHGELIELPETEVSIMEVTFDDHDEN
jgi:hypothetical protein